MNVRDHFCLAIAFGKASLIAFYKRKNQKLQRHLLSCFWQMRNKKVFKPGQIFFKVSKEYAPNSGPFTVPYQKYVSVVHWLIIKRTTLSNQILSKRCCLTARWVYFGEIAYSEYFIMLLVRIRGRVLDCVNCRVWHVG